MKKSIKYKLTLTLIILIGFTIFLCWYANKKFLVNYYEYSKINVLEKVYNDINLIYNSDKDSEEISIALERFSSNSNINIYVFYTYTLYRDVIMRYEYPKLLNREERIRIEERLYEYFFDAAEKNSEKELLKKSDKYIIYKIFDERIDSYYIEGLGFLDNDNMVYLRTNFEGMQESVAISNRFLTYVGVFAAFIGSIIMFFVCSSFSKPILELSNIAEQMQNLNFNIKYPVKRKDEIGRLGASINSLSEELEKTISELKTANNELKSDIENKIQIDEMRKEFLSNVTHELKTPIALIQGYAEGLKDNINDDEESKDFYCEVIMDEAMKMNTMVKKLLSLNQIESGSSNINFERFDIIQVINSVINSTNILFQQKGAICKFEYKESVYVWADEYLVEEVLTNYISNALNHLDENRIIEIKLILKEDVIRVSVFNTGDNIPEDDLEKIWVKFYKVDKARTREYGGSGIGLSIVKAIMTSLNQKFGVINHENGVEFWFELDYKN